MGREKVAVSDVAADALATLGGLVREARLEKGWTQRHLAAVAGASQRTVSLIERGDPAVSAGAVFNVAVAAGAHLFQVSDPVEMARLRYRGEEKLALMPQRVRKRVVDEAKYDF